MLTDAMLGSIRRLWCRCLAGRSTAVSTAVDHSTAHSPCPTALYAVECCRLYTTALQYTVYSVYSLQQSTPILCYNCS